MGMIINQMDIVPAAPPAQQPGAASTGAPVEQPRPPAIPPIDRSLRQQHERAARVRVY